MKCGEAIIQGGRSHRFTGRTAGPMRYHTIRRGRTTAPAAGGDRGVGKGLHGAGLQARVFLLVAAAFTTIYITQPVLPVIREEFGITAARASLTVSAVIFGIALATLPFGLLIDRFPARPILLAGGSLASLFGLLCAATKSLPCVRCATARY